MISRVLFFIGLCITAQLCAQERLIQIINNTKFPIDVKFLDSSRKLCIPFCALEAQESALVDVKKADEVIVLFRVLGRDISYVAPTARKKLNNNKFNSLEIRFLCDEISLSDKFIIQEGKYKWPCPYKVTNKALIDVDQVLSSMTFWVESDDEEYITVEEYLRVARGFNRFCESDILLESAIPGIDLGMLGSDNPILKNKINF